MSCWQLEGVGIAFAILYVISYLVYWAVSRRLTGYAMSLRGWKIIGGAGVIVAFGFLLTRITNPVWSVGMGVTLTAVSTVGSYFGLKKLLQIEPWDVLMRKLGVRKAA
jgi:ABC-type multidrug transport system fused ATPase/permease subunit